MLFKYRVDVMKAISEQDSSYDDMSWESKTIVAANGLSKLYHSFTFIMSFIPIMNAMSVIRPISVKLQHRSYDILQAYNNDKGVIEELCKLRSSDVMLQSWYSQAKYLADIALVLFLKFLALLVISSIGTMLNIILRGIFS